MMELLWQSAGARLHQSPGRRLRDMLDAGGIEPMPGSFNALSAQILERAGLKCSLLGGSAVSNSLLGLPDAEFLTLEQLALVCSHATSVVAMPIVADIDTGYGNAINATHAVHVFERAGAAGVMIEDQLAPKRSGHIAGKQVVSVGEMTGKIKAAAEARTDPDFFIIARCDARAVEGPDSAIARANAYAAAGADATFIDGAVSRDDLARFGGEVRSTYRIANMGGSAKVRTTPKVPLDELRAMGYSLAVFGLQVTRAAALGMVNFAAALHSRSQHADRPVLDGLHAYSPDAWRRCTGLDRLPALAECEATAAPANGDR